MNIIGGEAKNTILNVPKGLEVRPTSARARKAIFDSINNWNSMKIVDLFSGSGALGLEAASRGAAQVYFSEKSPIHCSFIEKNIESVKQAGVECQFKIVKGDSTQLYKMVPELFQKVDIIFADPPYAQTAEVIDELFSNEDFARWAYGAVFILETSAKSSKKPTVGFANNWRIKQFKNYGQSTFYLFESIIS